MVVYLVMPVTRKGVGRPKTRVELTAEERKQLKAVVRR
ncbi:MAG: hypothetical protein ACI835_005692, partial [Planctomycetota bacterium]